MTKQTTISVDLEGQTLTLESGLLALQAAASVTARLGDSVLFSAVTTANPREGIDFFPMQVEYREKFYAAGRMPGGYFKREARPSEKEILTARMTDRPLRPLFPNGFRDEVQINNAVLCADGKTETDILSITAASASLVLSEIPFFGPIAAVRVGRIQGKFVLNPTHKQITESDLNLIYAGTREKFMMMEGGADEITEEDFLAAMKFAQPYVAKICDAQLELRRKLGKADKQVADLLTVDPALMTEAVSAFGQEMDAALEISCKQPRQSAIQAIRESLRGKLAAAQPKVTEEQFRQLFDAFEIQSVRNQILEKGHRIGGRKFDELRNLSGQVGLLPRTHGSAMFNRGETQALAVLTLGTHSDAQSMDAITGGPTEKRFLLHYNFPPYSVGECGRLAGTTRREIGHGALAERSLVSVVPKDYPYTVRLVSEIMGSNGSSSMASICAGTLALMDAGVPIRAPVAGISIGLFTGPGKSVLVTDILGTEDHCGDMDFKIAGTRTGITGFQVDLKIRGLDWDQVQTALAMARAARMRILDAIEAVIPKPRAELSSFAPRITVIRISTEKIGALIGPGGKNIRRITDTFKVEVDIEDDGTVRVFSADAAAMDAATREIGLLTAEAEPGKLYEGRVTGVKDFGAFVEILPGMDGLVHISELADFRVNNVSDVCKVGDAMWVKCLSVDDNGKIRLSRRAAMEEKGREAARR